MTTRPLAIYTVVRVAHLAHVTRPWNGTEGVARSPRVGDCGTVVHVYAPNDPNTSYSVECVNRDGYTVWLADFAPNEIEPV